MLDCGVPLSCSKPRGNIAGFLQEYIAEEEKLLAEKNLVSGEGTSQVAPELPLQVDTTLVDMTQDQPLPPPESSVILSSQEPLVNPPPPEI